MINNVTVVARLAADPRVIACTNQDGSTYNMTSGLLIADMGTKDKPKAVSINFIGFGEGIQKLKKGTKIVVSGELVDIWAKCHQDQHVGICGKQVCGRCKKCTEFRTGHTCRAECTG